MKRKDKCEVAAYLKVIDFCGCNNCSRADDCQLSFSLMCNNGKSFIRGFLCGADWSDENQLSVIRGGKTNTIIWHDASEEPNRDITSKLIYYIEDTDNISIHTLGKLLEYYGEPDLSWNSVVKNLSITKWAYIDDLLPKKYIICQEK